MLVNIFISILLSNLQEISYGQLLIPSRQFVKEKKVLSNNENDVVDSGFPVQKHHLVSRYFTKTFLLFKFLFFSFIPYFPFFTNFLNKKEFL